jgi:hypothetical protein
MMGESCCWVAVLEIVWNFADAAAAVVLITVVTVAVVLVMVVFVVVEFQLGSFLLCYS